MVLAKRLLGAIAILLGAAILGWFAYNLVAPTAAFRRSFGSMFQLILPIAMVWVGWRWMRDDGPGIETLQIDPKAPELLAATERARRTLPLFLGAVRRHEDGAYVKFPLCTDAGVTEHIWAYVHHYADGIFNVSLANTPHTQKGEVETRRDVPEADIEDWQIMTRDGRIRGGYTLRALFEHVDANGIHLNRTMRKQRAQFTDAIDDVAAAGASTG